MSELTIAEVQEAVARCVPERDCIVQAGRSLSYGAFNERSRRLASYLLSRGIGCHRERAELQAWESGQDHIGLYLYNCAEYLIAEFGVLKARAAAININHRYVEKELLYLVRNASLKGLVFHSIFAPQVSAMREQAPGLDLLIQVPDESDAALLPGAVWFENALAAGTADFPQPPYSLDDLHILYTGGTTGMPKGVLWRQADIIIAALGGRRPDGGENDVADFVRCAQRSASRTLPAGPFMHASGRWTAMSQILLGNTVLLPTNTRRLDPDDIWSTLEREQAAGLNIAGDAFARPLLEQLGKKRYDLRSLRMLTSGAAVLSASVKRGLLEALPHIRISDTIGASETGPQASFVVKAGDAISKPSFSLTSSTTVISADRSRVLPPGNPEIGWLARSGHVPFGYLGDAEKTGSTYPVVEGIRYAVPGDRARWDDHGAIELLGREAAVINSGGEKVFAEEVEVALKQHPAIYDVVVCGRPNPRWGEEVVALVRLREGVSVTVDELIGECSKHVARYKLPKALLFRDEIRRSPSGKPDYAWARAEAVRGDRLAQEGV